jgi:hypothetical protein
MKYMQERLQTILENQQMVYEKIENTYATKDELDSYANKNELDSYATKDEVNKSLLFNTKTELISWLDNIPLLGENLFNMPSINGTDPVYNHQYSIIPDEENEGYFAYKLDVLGNKSGASNIELTKFTLNPGNYVISKSKYVYILESDLGLGKGTSTADITKEIQITNTREITICLSNSTLIENYKNGAAYVPNLFVHIKCKTPYVREDGLRKEDLKTGDLLLIKEENTPDYYWDGALSKIIETYSYIPPLANGPTAAGLIQTTSDITNVDGYTASPVVNGVPYYKDTLTDERVVEAFNKIIEAQDGFLGIIDSGTTGACTWKLDDKGTLIISGDGEMEGYTSSNKAPWGQKITNVIIKNGVTSMGADAFYSCDSLTSITIPNSIRSIGSRAFYSCSNLESITIGDSVTNIGSDAFYECSSLKNVYITDIAAWCKISFSSYYSNPLYRAENLYLNDELVTDLIIPNSVTTIKSSAFNNCTSLTSITIPDSVTSIGSAAFNNCTSLTNITIPNSVRSIVSYAFNNCTGLTSITIGDSVTSIGDRAFYNCTNLKTVYYKGSEADRAKISIGEYNDPLEDATWNYNYKG